MWGRHPDTVPGVCFSAITKFLFTSQEEGQEEGTVIRHLLCISYSQQSQEIGVVFTDQEPEAKKL